MDNNKETKKLEKTSDLFKTPEMEKIEKEKEDTRDKGYIDIRGKRKYILMSGVLGCWNDVLHERKVLTKRRRKNKLAKITRKQQRQAAKRK